MSVEVEFDVVKCRASERAPGQATGHDLFFESGPPRAGSSQGRVAIVALTLVPPSPASERRLGRRLSKAERYTAMETPRHALRERRVERHRALESKPL
jgi:hypothetical protein